MRYYNSGRHYKRKRQFFDMFTWLKFRYLSRTQLLFKVVTIEPVSWGQPWRQIVRRERHPTNGWKGDWLTSKAASVTRWHRSSLNSSNMGQPCRTDLTTVLLSWTQSERLSDNCGDNVYHFKENRRCQIRNGMKFGFHRELYAGLLK